MAMESPTCWECEGPIRLSPAKDAPYNELCCATCGMYFLGTPDEVAAAREHTTLTHRPRVGPMARTAAGVIIVGRA